MKLLARNLALEQKLATYAGTENTDIKSEGGTTQDVSEQVDEKFVKTCKVQVVEANLVAQDLRGERDALRKKWYPEEWNGTTLRNLFCQKCTSIAGALL